MSRGTVTAMCDVCGALRDYRGNRRATFLACQPCGRRTHHQVVGYTAWQDDHLRAHQSRTKATLAEVLHLADMLDALDIEVHELETHDNKSGDPYLYRIKRIFSMSHEVVTERWLEVHPRITLERRAEAYRAAIADATDPRAGAHALTPDHWSQGGLWALTKNQRATPADLWHSDI